MLKLVKQIWDDIKQGENIDLYLIVIISVPLVALNLMGISLTSSEPIILTVLTLLAISTLSNRRKLDSVMEKMNKSIDSILLKDFPKTWESDLEKSKEVWIIGISLTRTITTYFPLLQEKLKGKSKLRFLIISPNGNAYKVIGNRNIDSVTPEKARSVLLSTLESLSKLKQLSPSKVEIRTIDYCLPFGFLGLDLSSPQSVIYVENYPFKAKFDMPKMELHPKDEHWYNFFHEQLMNLWNSATEWEPSDRAL